MSNLINQITTQEIERSKKYSSKHKRVANTLDISPAKLGKGLIITWTLLTLVCHVFISTMLFFPSFEYVYDFYFIDNFRAFAWSLWFISSVAPIVGIVFLLFSWTDFFKSTLRHATNYQRGAFLAYWAMTIVAYTLFTVRSSYIYHEYSGLGAPDTWVNFFAIRAYNLFGRECLFFLAVLQFFALLSLYNWINAYKTTIWSTFNLYELKNKIKDGLGDGYDIFDARIMSKPIINELVEIVQ